ncbi:hypothetical protein ACWGPD_34090 [Streptomyces hirsutus]|uniref:hypothetical protein n=1 Tax=Streptomyces hirsutus TaxID=35620 RepID=UPI00364427A5
MANLLAGTSVDFRFAYYGDLFPGNDTQGAASNAGRSDAQALAELVPLGKSSLLVKPHIGTR